VLSVAYSTDGRWLVSAGADSSVKVWEAETGQEILSTRHMATPEGVAFSASGDRLVSSNGSMWDAQTGLSIPTAWGRLSRAALSPDGDRLAAINAYDHLEFAGVQIRDVQTRAPIQALRGHSDRVLSIAFSPDARRLASASMDGTLKVWEVTAPSSRPAKPDDSPK
jgi:WD40 repeat protein